MSRGAKVFEPVVKDNAWGPHTLHDPLSLKGSVKLDLTVDEIEEGGEDHVLKRC